ncbi:hypothetical protein swp_1583 [Shewanella piezotolerans WP3]|uniref:Uncharacterized protein n=1 Tax=Shewanella piezotolerans (strain WP3 / JCM 13877) TaxID=225849 RepID=B8CL40_SHEPW|nr:hypothetical protein swp_1583 [Shewanella piezotolerans WP3]
MNKDKAFETGSLRNLINEAFGKWLQTSVGCNVCPRKAVKNGVELLVKENKTEFI